MRQLLQARESVARARTGIAMADLQAISAFSKLGPSALALVQRAVVERAFSPGQMIFLEGEPGQGLWFLRSGRVRIYRMSAEGREQGLCVMRAGMCCGCPLFYGETNPASAEALDPVTMYFVRAAEALALAEQDPEIGRAFFGVFARGEQILSSLVVSLSCSHLTGRLAHLLLEQSEEPRAGALPPGPPAVALSHQDLAGLLGTSREVVTRTLDRLVRARAIRLGRRRILILDPARLRALAH
jgi:CRP/FNR family transcriptional regulator